MIEAERGEAIPTAAEPAPLPRRTGALLFVVALALRLPLLPRRALVEGDGVHYATLARDVLAGDPSGLANPYWSNLWPGVIAGFAWLTGLDVAAAGRFASLLAGAGLAVAVAALATRALGSRTGLVAGLLAAAHPWLIHFSSLLFTESFFALLLVMLLLRAVRGGRAADAAAAGAWAGLALVTRPEALAPTAAVLGGFLAPRRAHAWRAAGVVVLVALAPVLGRALLVRHYHGSWDFGGTKGTANLLVGLAGSDSDKERLATELSDDDQNALARTARRESVPGLVRAAPGRVLRHAVENGGRVLSSALRVFPFVPLVGGRASLVGGGFSPALAAWALALSALALYGLVDAVARNGAARLLAAAGLLYALGLTPFTVHDRLVVALVPLYLVYLAHGLVRVAERLALTEGRRRVVPLAFAALLGPLSLAALLRAPVLDYAADPVVQRQAGEWLAARYPQDSVLMTPAPAIEFYFHDAEHDERPLTLPWADYPQIIAIARRKDAALIAAPEWHLRATGHPAAAILLDPVACRAELRHAATLGSGGERVLLYELRQPRGAP